MSRHLAGAFLRRADRHGFGRCAQIGTVGEAVKTAQEQAKNYKRHQLYKLIERSHIDPESTPSSSSVTATG